MYFYQVDRVNLTHKVKEYAHFITGRTLDVGAGENQRYSFPSSKYVRMNTDMNQDVPGGAKTDVVGRAEDIPVPDASFNSIICTQTLVDVFDLQKAFGEFTRVLKPGGMLLVTTPFMLDRQDSEYQYWHMTDHALRRLSVENGFEVVALEGCGGFWSGMVQLISRYLLRRFKLKKRRWARLASAIIGRIGTLAIYLDTHSKNEAGKHFTDNWILVARKV
ncbi:hypothetical protein A2765_00620 [Candidatus Kaiserbacteria bacterium RIFCSPHIGHO2_01_FULL_56_24]|uniref:Methyltransferase type 11 domain-containing protein n=1 Tax=Candidatus Kaiserbacteria bacterium RIFCSPHIGHO2_01_FULL_56_24 TaxID=1798487 RepID=A0A1F6DBS4_9BACT|nr:MAG: hypothetical protein A2765_00620 [Candidatus Kaiserbacteria bacterium RIFCSPHIGHO2_01_FULL_56_24]